MNEKYLPKDLDGKIVHVAEECAELQHAILKAVRFGLFARHPETKALNIMRIIEEAGDASAAINAMCKALLEALKEEAEYRQGAKKHGSK